MKTTFKNTIKGHTEGLISNISEKPLGISHYTELIGGNYQQKDKKSLEYGGVYSYWWATDPERFYEMLEKTNQITLFGKQEKGKAVEVDVEFNKEWVSGATHEGAILLYVGRSTNIGNRMTGHIRPQTPSLKSDSENNRKPNTVSQLRYGLERLFKIDDARELIMKYVHLSTVKLCGYDSSVERFYLEQAAIGNLYPLLNIDIER
jgi:hypothetical protein